MLKPTQKETQKHPALQYYNKTIKMKKMSA
uniref:Uncharacterized protein n=1 Tax=Rhizophora mucronata TaxID=61149 RepID=A0A2P2J4G2_RHIMU